MVAHQDLGFPVKRKALRAPRSLFGPREVTEIDTWAVPNSDLAAPSHDRVRVNHGRRDRWNRAGRGARRPPVPASQGRAAASGAPTRSSRVRACPMPRFLARLTPWPGRISAQHSFTASFGRKPAILAVTSRSKDAVWGASRWYISTSLTETTPAPGPAQDRLAEISRSTAGHPRTEVIHLLQERYTRPPGRTTIKITLARKPGLVRHAISSLPNSDGLMPRDVPTPDRSDERSWWQMVAIEAVGKCESGGGSGLVRAGKTRGAGGVVWP
jgi:hypothetical protein